MQLVHKLPELTKNEKITFNNTTIASNVLINERGIIIARNLKGAALI